MFTQKFGFITDIKTLTEMNTEGDDHSRSKKSVRSMVLWLPKKPLLETPLVEK